jgi:hypothetical protein
MPLDEADVPRRSAMAGQCPLMRRRNTRENTKRARIAAPCVSKNNRRRAPRRRSMFR